MRLRTHKRTNALSRKSANVTGVEFDIKSKNNCVTVRWGGKQSEINLQPAKAIRRCYITKPGRKLEKCPIGISTVRDRVVQTALRNVTEPIFENEFAENSYGFRPHRRAKDALREVRKSLDKVVVQVLDTDIQGFFDTIDQLPSDVQS